MTGLSSPSVPLPFRGFPDHSFAEDIEIIWNVLNKQDKKTHMNLNRRSCFRYPVMWVLILTVYYKQGLNLRSPFPLASWEVCHFHKLPVISRVWRRVAGGAGARPRRMQRHPAASI